MGCDIHLKIQFKDNETGQWLYSDAFIDKPITDSWTRDYNTTNGKWSVEKELSERSYMRFAILGDVRNGYGFAGVFTHEPLPYISKNRGIPEDLKLPPPETYKYYEDYVENGKGPDEDEQIGMWFGDHSFSWVTLKELMEYDYTRKLIEGGVVSIKEYRKWKNSDNSTPDNWAGGVSGPNIVVVEEGCADAVLAVQGRNDKVTHIQATWGLPLREALGERWFWCIEALLIEAEKRGISPENVRLVFGFDS